MGEGYPKLPTIPPAGPDREVPHGTYPPGQGTYPPARSQWGRVYSKVPPPVAKLPTPPPSRSQQGEGVSQGTYPLPPRDRTAYRVLDSLRSVCLLRSHRRTFLSLYFIYLGDSIELKFALNVPWKTDYLDLSATSAKQLVVNLLTTVRMADT